MAVGPLAVARGLEPMIETGLFGSDEDYRVPDQLYRRPDQGSDRGAEGAEMVVEVRSQGDETYEKFQFYAAFGVREVLVLRPGDRRAELFRLRDGQLVAVLADEDGSLHSEVLGIGLATRDGKLRITWPDGSVEI